MKNNIYKILAIIFCFTAFQEVVAQYGYGGYGRRDMYGRRISAIPRSVNQMGEDNKPKNLTAEEIVAEQMPAFKEALGLTVFEEAVVSSILTKYVQQRIELQILKLEPQKMRESFEEIQRNQEKELQSGLPPEKFEAYMNLQEENFKNLDKKAKEKKKKRRKKKN